MNLDNSMDVFLQQFSVSFPNTVKEANDLGETTQIEAVIARMSVDIQTIFDDNLKGKNSDI